MAGDRRGGPRSSLLPFIQFTEEITMPSSNSAKKRLRQNQAHRLHNRSIKSNVRSSIRKVRTAVDAGDVEASAAAFQVVTKKLDQVAGKGTLHHNTVSRRKSRLARRLNAALAAHAG